MSTVPQDEHRVLVHGRSTLYLEAGDGPVLLLVHGNVTTFRSWRRIAAEFRSTHRVLAPALPGYGGTSPLPEMGLDGLVSFLAGFLDALSVDEAIVVGHSAGGLIAGAFALQHPHRVSRLALVDSSGLGRAVNPALIAGGVLPGWAAKLATFALLLPGTGVPRVLLSGLQLRRPWRVTVREWREQIRLTQTSTLLGTSFDAARMATGWTGQRGAYRIDDRLGELRMPTLLVWGLTDELYPVWQGLRAARKAPDGRFAILMGAGHVGYLDSHVEFIDALGPFVRDQLEPVSAPGDAERRTTEDR